MAGSISDDGVTSETVTLVDGVERSQPDSQRADELPGGASAWARCCAGRQTAKGRLVEGLVLIFGVNVIWVAASVLVQYIYETFQAPFFLTYVSNSLFMVFLPGVFAISQAQKRSSCSGALSACGATRPYSKAYTLKQVAKISLLVCPVWFTAQSTYNASLGQTSVSSSTILSTTSSLFTFGLSVAFLKERFMWHKLAGVFACLAGAAIVSIADKDSEGSDTFWGDMLCILSAFAYGCYTNMIRYLVPDEESVSMPLFFGLLGLFNSMLLLPIVVILNAKGTESLNELTGGIMGLIIVKGLFDNVLSDFLWARAILLTSPTVATVGLSMTIPLAMLSDLVFKGLAPTWQVLLGSVLVTVGFVGVNVGTAKDKAEAKQGAGARPSLDSVDSSRRPHTGSDHLLPEN